MRRFMNREPVNVVDQVPETRERDREKERRSLLSSSLVTAAVPQPEIRDGAPVPRRTSPLLT